ncbi:hypothetical protein YTPLAS18_24200 [Nitrospira sp.]|nr:hypothetical protein YTPLAS18_24200 [Nitrospira sp.]
MPPTAAPVPFQGLAAGCAALFGGADQLDRVTREMCDEFEVESAFLVSSGKAALAVVLQALHQLTGRRKVVIPAYTCYSVPSAVVKAGLEVVPCDVEPKTLDFNFDQLGQVVDGNTLCVLATHLFGAPADVDRIRSICRNRDTVLVEDAAQAMGGVTNGRALGTIGDVGFFSLGRGKNLSAGGGGIIVTRSREIGVAIKEEWDRLGQESFGGAVKNLAEMAATSVLINPGLYWLPAGLPFLGLGETRFYRDFPILKMGEARAATLKNWKGRLTSANAVRGEQARAYLEELRAYSPHVAAVSSPGAVYLRLPILVRDRAMKREILQRATALGLGMSQAYPGTIRQVPELEGALPPGDAPGSREVVDRLLTLPTHRFVTSAHRRAVCRLLEDVAVGGSATPVQQAVDRTVSSGRRAVSNPKCW